MQHLIKWLNWFILAATPGRQTSVSFLLGSLFEIRNRHAEGYAFQKWLYSEDSASHEIAKAFHRVKIWLDFARWA